MKLNPIGLASAAALFTGVWAGHVAVRTIEARIRKLWPPVIFFLALGLILEFLSLCSENDLLSAILGILGITAVWDGFEFVRQEKRVKKGHAPANPENPRHAVFLSAAGSNATRNDLLKREPVGRKVDPVEAQELVQ
ncbi:MAG: DUF4491 family protein [Anaerolineales bacterium]|nr:DUF4491 family protein [Anaerolineales bacterium]